MPNWSTTIPSSDNGVALPVRRTPTSGALVALCTSEDMLGCDTHFYGGHTVPCTRPDCKACADGMPFRWHAYIAALEEKNRLHFIFECTAQAADAFRLYREAHHTLRGCLFEARRWHSRPNGRVIIRTKAANLTHLTLPHPPDVRKCMAIVWQIPDPDLELGQVVKGVPSIAVTPEDQRRGA